MSNALETDYLKTPPVGPPQNQKQKKPDGNRRAFRLSQLYQISQAILSR